MNPVWGFILPVKRSMKTASDMINVQSAFFGFPSLSVPSFKVESPWFTVHLEHEDGLGLL